MRTEAAMRKIDKPVAEPLRVFTLCVKGIDDSATRKRLISVKGEIERASNEFEAAAVAETIYTIAEKPDVQGIVTKSEMSDVYKIGMVDKASKGRAIYDGLMGLAPLGICPLCGQRTVSTLDHHLPKSKFPTLAVTPCNLVPACGDCNKAKSTRHATTAEKQTLHPYFDDFERQRWLYARVVRKSPPALRFRVRPPPSWTTIWRERVKEHFRVFKLAKLYTSQAGSELINIRYRLEEMYKQVGAIGVRTHLEQEAKSRERAHLNSWQTAMYKALSKSKWFCNAVPNVFKVP
jgi:hypothetical protein